MYKILVVEDNKEISDIISLYIENDNQIVISAYDGQEGLEMFNKTDIDLVIADIMMPKRDGYSLIKEIRKTSNVPIIILSSKGQIEDKVLGLNIGADDYLEKPFNSIELTARVNAQLRRYYKLGADSFEQPSKTIYKELEIYYDEIKVLKNGVDIFLTTIEFKILKLLTSSPGRVFTKSQIYEHVSGVFFESDDNTIMVHISNLRSKVEDDPRNPKYITNVRGIGYKVEK